MLLFGLQIKHFAADYLLQPDWMIKGKHSVAKPGGYLHVGVHAVGSLIVLLACGVGGGLLGAILAGEAIVHYCIDFAKVRWSKAFPAAVSSRAFWAAHGFDQLMHQLTYVAMIVAVLVYGAAD